MHAFIHNPSVVSDRQLEQTIRSIIEAWDELKLEILNPVKSSDILDTQWQAVALARYEPNYLFLRIEAPLKAADFTSAAQNEITDWAKRQTNVHDVRIINGTVRMTEKNEGYRKPLADPQLEEFAHAFGRDTNKIHNVLFKMPVHNVRITGGLVQSSLAPFLHIDGLNEEGICYLARINTLPFEIIQGRDTFGMTNVFAAVIATARLKGPENTAIAAAARQSLRDMKKLNVVDLGAVMITFRPKFVHNEMLNKSKEFQPQEGTMHCSMETPPKDGAYSALFQGMGYLRPQPA